MTTDKIYYLIRVAKKKQLINNQQKKTLIGQVKVGEVEAAHKGLIKIVNRNFI